MNLQQLEWPEEMEKYAVYRSDHGTSQWFELCLRARKYLSKKLRREVICTVQKQTNDHHRYANEPHNQNLP